MWAFIKRFKNKYLLVITIFGVWMLFFDRNNLFTHISLHKQKRTLESDKEYYKAEIKKDSIAMVELMTNPKTLEKFAREQYLMKKPDEEVFVIKRKK